MLVIPTCQITGLWHQLGALIALSKCYRHNYRHLLPCKREYQIRAVIKVPSIFTNVMEKSKTFKTGLHPHLPYAELLWCIMAAGCGGQWTTGSNTHERMSLTHFASVSASRPVGSRSICGSYHTTILITTREDKDSVLYCARSSASPS